MPLALGVAPPSLSGTSFAAPELDCVVGEERKKSGDCVEGAWRRLALGVAFSPRCDACEASECSWASGPSGGGLEASWEEFLALLRGVAELRCERRCAGEDIEANGYHTKKPAIRTDGGRVASRRGKGTRRVLFAFASQQALTTRRPLYPRIGLVPFRLAG